MTEYGDFYRVCPQCGTFWVPLDEYDEECPHCIVEGCKSEASGDIVSVVKVCEEEA